MMADDVRLGSEHGPLSRCPSRVPRCDQNQSGKPVLELRGKQHPAPPKRTAARNLLDANRTSASPIAKCWPFQDCTDVAPPSHADISERTHAASFTGLQFEGLALS